MNESREDRLRALRDGLRGLRGRERLAVTPELIIDELDAILAMPETVGLPWVSVEERLPDWRDTVLWKMPVEGFRGGIQALMIGSAMQRDDGVQYTIGSWTKHESHWNVLPTHWLSISSIPLPGSGLVEAGVLCGSVVTIQGGQKRRLSADDGQRLLVWLQPLEDKG